MIFREWVMDEIQKILIDTIRFFYLRHVSINNIFCLDFLNQIIFLLFKKMEEKIEQISNQEISTTINDDQNNVLTLEGLLFVHFSL